MNDLAALIWQLSDKPPTHAEWKKLREMADMEIQRRRPLEPTSRQFIPLPELARKAGLGA